MQKSRTIETLDNRYASVKDITLKKEQCSINNKNAIIIPQINNAGVTSKLEWTLKQNTITNINIPMYERMNLQYSSKITNIRGNLEQSSWISLKNEIFVILHKHIRRFFYKSKHVFTNLTTNYVNCKMPLNISNLSKTTYTVKCH